MAYGVFEIRSEYSVYNESLSVYGVLEILIVKVDMVKS